MTPSKILFFICISFILGIFLESAIKIPQFILWAFLFVVVVTIFVSLAIWKFRFYAVVQNVNLPLIMLLVSFCVLFLLIGILRMQITEFNIQNNNLIKLNGLGQVVLTGFVADEADLRDNSQKIKVKTEYGIVLVTTARYPEYQYIDKIKIIGNPQTPSETEEFSYKNYLMKDGIYSVINFPKIENLGKASGSPSSATYSFVLNIKQKLRAGIQKNFLPPQSSVLQGMILGDRNVISQDLKDKLSVTGTSHIIAVSGTHIVILGAIIMNVLLLFGLWRGQAFYFSIILICLYIVLVGLPSSGIRAGIMAIAFLTGQKFGRQAMSSRIIVLAGSSMLLQNPLLLFYDIGFQLSFLAVLGMIYFDPILRSFIKFLIKKYFRKEIGVRYDNSISIFTVTISAQIFTLPIIVYNFGRISLVSPLTNILLAPVVYYLMLFGFLSAVITTMWSFLGWIISLPCYFIMIYFLGIIDFFSKPWAYATMENVSWIWLFASYLVIIFFIRFLRQKFRPNFI